MTTIDMHHCISAVVCVFALILKLSRKKLSMLFINFVYTLWYVFQEVYQSFV